MPGYVPNEFDFCVCGATFQPQPKIKGRARIKRFCGQCGAPEGKRMSYHDRTGKPYTRERVEIE
jgi:hypothetical protein